MEVRNVITNTCKTEKCKQHLMKPKEHHHKKKRKVTIVETTSDEAKGTSPHKNKES